MGIMGIIQVCVFIYMFVNTNGKECSPEECDKKCVYYFENGIKWDCKDEELNSIKEVIDCSDYSAASMTAPKPTGTVPGPSGTVPGPSGTVPGPSGTVPQPSGTVPQPSRTVPQPSGTVPGPSGTVHGSTGIAPSLTVPSSSGIADLSSTAPLLSSSGTAPSSSAAPPEPSGIVPSPSPSPASARMRFRRENSKEICYKCVLPPGEAVQCDSAQTPGSSANLSNNLNVLLILTTILRQI